MMQRKIKYNLTESFKKDVKKLQKKFKTLEEDIGVAKRNSIELFHLHSIDNQSVVHMMGYVSSNHQIYKLRKFACRSLKGKGAQSGIRIIYAYFPQKQSVTFIEIYFKGMQENEDKNKIKAFLMETKEDGVIC